MSNIFSYNIDPECNLEIDRSKDERYTQEVNIQPQIINYQPEFDNMKYEPGSIFDYNLDRNKESLGSYMYEKERIQAHKNDNSYFSYIKRKYPGDENFINKISAMQIQKSAKERIFREMLRGSIDYAEYGKYFLEPKFLKNLILAAQNELINNGIIKVALEEYNYNHPGNLDVFAMLDKYRNYDRVYNYLYQKLIETETLGNIGPLTSIQYEYYMDRNVL